MKNQKDIIEQTLTPLIGLPIWSIGRGGTLEWFAFGFERKEVPTRKGGTKIVSEYALHVECAWRIVGPQGILVASRDRYYPAGDDPYKDVDEFEWDVQGANQCDERVMRLLAERHDHPLTVLSIRADAIGSIYLGLSAGYSLEIFPDCSVVREYWRLFQPDTDTSHFFVGKDGISWQ